MLSPRRVAADGQLPRRAQDSVSREQGSHLLYPENGVYTVQDMR